MPKSPYPKDRFDDLPADARRLGAHRADNPRTLGAAGWVIALVATLALIAAGVIGTLLATDRLSLFPQPSASTPAATIQPVLDTSFSILLIDASGQDGVVAAVRSEVLAAGWSEDKVSESSSDASDFETTTVYYAAPEDQAAARGLADAIGVEWVELNDSYQPVDDPQTTDVDEGGLMQLVVAIGRDRLAG